MKEDKKINGPVGFFPLSFNLAETGRAILVAKELKKLGGKPIIFTHGGQYDYLPRKMGLKTIKIKPFFTDEISRQIVSINRKEKKGIPYKEDFLREAVKEEIKAFKESKIKMLVSFVNLPSSISTKVLDIFHINVCPGAGNFHYSIPDYLENKVTRLIPQKIKIPIFNLFFGKTKSPVLKPFNKIAKEYNLKPFKNTYDLIRGDITLATNFHQFLDVFFNQREFADENYVGIILLEDLFQDIFPIRKKREIQKEIDRHINKKEKSIFLSMGSSGDKDLFIEFLKELNKTNYRVIALTGNILKEKKLPTLNENILLKKFVPSTTKIHKKVDISIIHGGQGTVYSAAYAAKPVIGVPMVFEQQLHLEKIVGHGTGLMLSKKFYKKNDLLKSINKIFDDYDRYLDNAKKLAEKLPPPKGEKNTAKRICEILNKIH